jgi:hypothetical protein
MAASTLFPRAPRTSFTSLIWAAFAASLLPTACSEDCPAGTVKQGDKCRFLGESKPDAATNDDADAGPAAASKLPDSGRAAETSSRCGNGSVEANEACDCPNGRPECELVGSRCDTLIDGAEGWLWCGACRFELSKCVLPTPAAGAGTGGEAGKDAAGTGAAGKNAAGTGAAEGGRPAAGSGGAAGDGGAGAAGERAAGSGGAAGLAGNLAAGMGGANTAGASGAAAGPMCAGGEHDCNGACVDDSALASCGWRCSPCDAPANASPLCSAGECDFSCNVGFFRCAAASCGPQAWTFETGTREQFELDSGSSPASAGAISVDTTQHFQGSYALRAPMAASPATGKQILLNAQICPGEKLDLSRRRVSARVFLEGAGFPSDAYVQIWLWGAGHYHYISDAVNPTSGTWLLVEGDLSAIADNTTAYGVAIVVALREGQSWSGQVWVDAVRIE